jgi:hypothetical protein
MVKGNLDFFEALLNLPVWCGSASKEVCCCSFLWGVKQSMQIKGLLSPVRHCFQSCSHGLLQAGQVWTGLIR